jgi:hypothetical protein
MKVFMYLNIFLFLTILFRNAIFPFLTLFVWWIVEGIFSVQKSLKVVSDYLPLNTISKIVESPFSRINLNPEGMATNNLYAISDTIAFPWLSFILGIVYSVAFIYGSYLILKKRDW